MILQKISKTLFALVLLALVSCETELVTPVGSSSQTLSKNQSSSNAMAGRTATATISTTPDTPVEFFVKGMPDGGLFTVNWGDGITRSYAMSGTEIYISHEYATPGLYNVTLSGDLNEVTSLVAFQGAEWVRDFNLDRLRNLEDISFGYSRIDVLDVSKNTKLQTVTGLYSELMTNIILPNHHQINMIEFGGSAFTTEVVDRIVESVYRNAVKQNIRDGRFALASIMEENPEFSGPPSESSLAKLRILRDEYGWSIFPNP